MTDPQAQVDSIKCEVNLVFPCLQKLPTEAKYMVRYAMCDCDPDDEDFIPAHSMCAKCLEYVLAKPTSACSACGTLYSPGKDIYAEIVRFRA